MKRARLLVPIVLGIIIGLGIGFLVWGNPRYELMGTAGALYVLDTHTRQVWCCVGTRSPKLCGVIRRAPDGPSRSAERTSETPRQELERLRREGYAQPAPSIADLSRDSTIAGILRERREHQDAKGAKP